jgi:hypothetical protein
MHHATQQAERSKTRYHPSDSAPYAQAARRSIHQPHTSLGAAGHWIHLLSVAAPLVIAEVIKDPDKKWRALRLASVGGAILSEAAWTMKISHDKKRSEEARAELDACRDQHCR